MKHTLPSLVLGSFCSVLALQSAVADTRQPITTMKKVAVSADRIDQTAQKDSRSIDSVGKETLDETQPNSVAEAVKYAPNVSVAGGSVPGNQSVNIRGMEGNKVLQVIDGTRVNTNFSHRPSYQLDPALLSSVDVVKGPVSSLWGSGAIGGVVSQNTITADDLVDDGKSLGGLVKGGLNSNGDQWSTTAAVAGKQGAFDWLLGATYLDADQMEQGNGDTLYGSETQNATALAKLNWQINEANKLGLNYRTSDDDGHPPVVGSTDDQLNSKDALIDRKTRDEHLALSYNLNPVDNDYIDLDSKLYRNHTRIEEVNLNNGKDLSDIETVGFSITNKASFDQLNLLAGIDGYEDSFDTDRPGSGGGDGRPTPPTDAKTTTAGAFLYGDYQLLDTVVLEAGVRYDQFKSKADGSEDSDESALSPSVGISWQASSWANFSLRYDEAFRAPDVYELYMSGTHFAMYPGGPSNLFTPNPDLKPETSSNYEFKGDFNFSNVFADDELNITAAVFDNKVEDFIQLSVYVPQNIPPQCFIPGMGEGCAGTSTSENVAKARLQGFEIAADYQLNALSASLSYGQTRGEDRDTKEDLSNIPADKWVAELGYALWAIDSKVGVRAIKTGDQDHTPSSDTQGPYEGYTTADFYATWEPTSEALEGVKVDLTVANAFDYNYRNAWSSVYEVGRSVRLSAQYSF
ncbi:hemoglobin/transferrin/lactoferrin receptor protein [Sinobacterium caligoides]|uniref:Hemoglobin/transferrin/lactoferrin receptor protein n=1 Tax=Sinobacterium caligoides TaxID=933926 RepID=A0A3N2DKM5_9GAMM|nr:TonB-dependent hemoglobin/transferrin/lactoferrin family receptor [Sinobacterium caligoides]ROS00350.1 hemoglobin/transferrin/lactoferrin receptor protein [Sinobacterium caligoides]